MKRYVKAFILAILNNSSCVLFVMMFMKFNSKELFQMIILILFWFVTLSMIVVGIADKEKQKSE